MVAPDDAPEDRTGTLGRPMPQTEVKVADPVTLLGSEGNVSIDAQQIARTAGTISYSVLCGISARVKRLYV